MAQNPHEVSQLVRSLEAARGSRRGGGKLDFSCKKTTYAVSGSQGIHVDSWKFNDWDYHKPHLPTHARGLFTTKRSDGSPEIAIRGYEKFFNVNEVKETEWENIERDTVGPYELSVKENGCIIFMSGLEDGTLLVCSKHSTGAREDAEKSHAINGERWVDRHVASVGKSKQDLAQKLRELNVTAVAELCDDAFEEHVLAYPPDMAGLYIHGLNFNLPEFATMSGSEVHEFADAWGFKKAQYLTIESIEKVRDFLQGCAETGSWDGRDTEGFVVRCHKRSIRGQAGGSWFFKYKFEEPYLMYRQWRECTKAVLAGRPPKIRKHKKVTDEYLQYARRQFAKDPKLGKLYNANHGIIAIRDGFLAEKGVKGSDIIANEHEEEPDDNSQSARDIVLVPIATIGCGKTTVASALVKLFGYGHVQNDNIQGSKNRAGRFVVQITNSLSDRPVVIADRNNHQKRERAQLMEDVRKFVPHAKFVAMHYVHDPKERMLADIRKVTTRRVLDRGDNHQTIHAGSKGQDEILGIMDGFLHRFQGIDTNREPDANFDLVIDLDVFASSRENLETVVNRLYNTYPRLFPEEMPTHQDMEDAIAWAMDNVVDVQHDLSGTFGGHTKPPNSQTDPPRPQKATPAPQPLAPEQVLKRVEYFSVSVSTTVISSTLADLFAHGSEAEMAMFRELRRNHRVQDHFHVTLMHRASATTRPDLWAQYTDALAQRIVEPVKKAWQVNPSLGPTRIRLERVVWDGRIMAFVVRILPNDDGMVWESANPIPHITVGTASTDIKPKESNDLLKRWEAGDSSGGKIWEKDVPGLKLLEGAVRPVMQRGR